MGKKKRASKPILISTLDTETRGLFGKVFRVGFYDGKNYYAYNSFSDLKPIIQELAKKYEVHIYVHNLDFDLSKIGLDVVPDAIFNDSIFIENNVTVFATKDIIFHDSFRILPSSLAKLCESFGLAEDERKINLEDHIKARGWAVYFPNGEYDKFKSEEYYFMNVEPDEFMLNLYLEYDCRSLHTIIMKVLELSCLEIEDFVKCPTTASLAMKVFKENYPDDYKDAISTNYYGKRGEFAEGFIRFGYYGGRTEVFQPKLENGYHYDVNSLYPYVMKVNDFPIGYYQIHENQKSARTAYLVWKNLKKGAGFLEANIYVPEHLHIPPLPFRDPKGGKLLFPVGRLHGVWTFHEVELAERMGCKIEKYFQAISWDKTYPIFREYVEYWEDIKRTSKGAKREFSKLMLNSLYGKFGMNRVRRTLVDITDEPKLIEKNIHYVKYENDYVKKDFLQVEVKSRARYIQPHLAAYVTSFARIHLYESLIRQQDTGAVCYCDTDSIACESNFPEELIHPDEFGKWALEGVIEKAIFLQPKLYAEKYKSGKEVLKAKGVPKDELKKFTFELFEQILEKILNGENRIELFKDKIVRKKFATMLKNGEHFDTPQVLRKGINLLAKQKRVMDYKNNKTKPHYIPEYGASYKDYLKQNELKEKEFLEVGEEE